MTGGAFGGFATEAEKAGEAVTQGGEQLIVVRGEAGHGSGHRRGRMGGRRGMTIGLNYIVIRYK